MKENSADEWKDIEIMENIIKDYIKADECGLSNNDFKCKTQALIHILSDYKRVLKENKELKADNYELNNRINDLLDNIPVQKIKDILNEINKEYIKQEEIFNKHFERENRDMQDYYIQKEATNIMQELSWVEGKLQELLESEDKL